MVVGQRPKARATIEGELFTFNRASKRVLFLIGGKDVNAIIMTLCHQCAQPFFDDRNYRITLLPIDFSVCRDRCDIECFICSHRGREYEVIKKQKQKQKQTEDHHAG